MPSIIVTCLSLVNTFTQLSVWNLTFRLIWHTHDHVRENRQYSTIEYLEKEWGEWRWWLGESIQLSQETAQTIQWCWVLKWHHHQCGLWNPRHYHDMHLQCMIFMLFMLMLTLMLLLQHLAIQLTMLQLHVDDVMLLPQCPNTIQNLTVLCRSFCKCIIFKNCSIQKT